MRIRLGSDLAPALPFRTALGGLIIKEKLGISDRETVEQIKGNPFLYCSKNHTLFLIQVLITVMIGGIVNNKKLFNFKLK